MNHSIIDLVCTLKYKSKYDIKEIITNCNEKYRQEPWIYDGHLFSQRHYVLLNDEHILLAEPFLIPLIVSNIPKEELSDLEHHDTKSLKCNKISDPNNLP